MWPAAADNWRRLRLVALMAALAWGGAVCSEDEAEPEAAAAPDSGVAPVVFIEQPSAGLRVAERWLPVRGTVQPEADVVVGGVAAHVADGRFEALVELHPGEQTVRACPVWSADADGGAAGCDERLVTMDTHAPQLLLLSPERGSAWPDDGPTPTLKVTVDPGAEADLVALRVDGVLVPMDAAGGTHEAPLDSTPGVHLVIVEAEDAAGNVAQDHCSYLAGPLEEPGPATRAASVLHVGAEALGALESLVNRTALGFDPAPLIADGPVLYASDAVRLRLIGLSWGVTPPARLRLDRKGLRTEVQLRELAVTLSLESPEPGIEPTPFEVSVQRLYADGVLGLGAEGGVPKASFSVDEILAEGLRVRGLLDPLFDEDSLLGELVEGLAPVVLQALLEHLLPVYLEEALAKLLRPWRVPLPDTDLEIEPRLRDAQVDAYGLRLWIELGADLPAGPNSDGRRGLATLRHLPPPTPRPHPGVTLVLAEDMLNLLLYRAWQAGTLDGVVDQAWLDEAKAEIWLVAGMLGTLPELRGVDPETPLRLQLTPSLPPYARLEPDRAELVVGDMHLDARCADGTPLMHAALSGRLVLTPRGGPRSEQLDPGVQQLDLLLDVLDAELHEQAETDYEPIVRSLLQGLGPSLAGLLVPQRLPPIFGVQLHDLELLGVPEGGYVILEARVAEEAP